MNTYTVVYSIIEFLIFILNKCDECDFRTEKKAYLRDHKRRHKVKDIKCNQCDYATNTQVKLRRHIFNHHTDVKDKTEFKCEECGFITYTQDRMSRHYLTRV